VSRFFVLIYLCLVNWKCPKCKYSNYPHRETCYRCSGPCDQPKTRKVSKVIHVHGLPELTAEHELIAICTKFGVVKGCLLLPDMKQALVEMERVEDATSLVTAFTRARPVLRSKEIVFQYSKSRNLNLEGKVETTPTSPDKSQTTPSSADLAGRWGKLFREMQDAERLGKPEDLMQCYNTLVGLRHLPPISVFYSTLCSLGRLGMVAEADNVYKEFLSRRTSYHRGAKTNVFNAYIFCLGCFNRKGEIDQVLHAMQHNQVKPDVRTFINALDAYRKSRDLPGMWKIYDRFQHYDVETNTDVYNIFLNAAAELHDVQLLRKFFEEMLSRGLKPNTHSFNIVLKTFCESEPPDVEKAEATYSELIKTVKPDACTFNTLMAMYKSLPLPHSSKIFEIFEQMERFDIEPNLAIYNTLISLQAKLGNTAQMLVFFDSIQHRGLVPNSHTYTCLVTALAKQGNYSKAIKLFNQAKMQGISFNSVFYLGIIESYAAIGDSDNVQAWVEKFKLAGFPVSVHLQNMILKCLSFKGSRELVEAQYKTLTLAFTPTPLTYHLMMGFYSQHADLASLASMYRMLLEAFPARVICRSKRSIFCCIFLHVVVD
jgi:pentatricopeptide repeat protein